MGAYELDIYGKVEGSDTIVIIENQLQATNHTHLGQLITYAAGLEAAIIIWIASEIRDEHRSAVEWLNRNTNDNISFFLIRPEVIKVDDSKPAVRFQLEVAPSEFERKFRGTIASEEAPRHEFRRKFWSDLLIYLAMNGHSWAKNRRTTKESWIASAIGRSGINVNVAMTVGSRIRVEIYCSDDSEKQDFQILFANKANFEECFKEEEISWEPLEGSVASRVAVYRTYDKEQSGTDTSHRKELFAWIDKNLKIMRELAKKYLIAK